MLTKSIITTAKMFLMSLINMLGGIIPLPDWAGDTLNYLFSAVANGANLIKWIIPNETIYESILALAIGCFSVWVTSKIIGFCIRLYDLILV